MFGYNFDLVFCVLCASFSSCGRRRSRVAEPSLLTTHKRHNRSKKKQKQKQIQSYKIARRHQRLVPCSFLRPLPPLDCGAPICVLALTFLCVHGLDGRLSLWLLVLNDHCGAHRFRATVVVVVIAVVGQHCGRPANCWAPSSG